MKLRLLNGFMLGWLIASAALHIDQFILDPHWIYGFSVPIFIWMAASSLYMVRSDRRFDRASKAFETQRKWMISVEESGELITRSSYEHHMDQAEASIKAMEAELSVRPHKFYVRRAPHKAI